MYKDIMLDALMDKILMMKVCRVIESVDHENQLLTLRKYCNQAKKVARIKLITNAYIDNMYAKARDKVLGTTN